MTWVKRVKIGAKNNYDLWGQKPPIWVHIEGVFMTHRRRSKGSENFDPKIKVKVGLKI